MKILIISHEATLTGAPKFAFLLAEHLSNSKHRVSLLLNRGGGLSETFVKLETKQWVVDLSNSSIVSRLFFNFIGGTLGHQKRILNWVKLRKFDVIINNTVMNGDIITKIKSVNSNIVTVVHEMDTVLRWAESMNNSTTKSLNSSKSVVCVSESVKSDLTRLFDTKKVEIEVLPGFAQVNRNFSTKKTDGSFVVGGCGSLIYRKGVDLFFHVAKLMKTKYPKENIKFMWVGGVTNSYSYFEFMNEVSKLQLEDTITITGETNNPEKYFSQMDIFFLSSREDPFPLVMMEVAQFEVPIICFSGCGGAEQFALEGGGLVSPYYDIESVLERIVEIKNNKSFHQSLRERVKETASNYNYSSVVPKWVSFIENFE